eukprot:CAMPEP_0198729572 /NCGR_PEP_ID=MMETSP1475-20131203/19636_1 /TAXON_ID= ORGANISM="Unidentified sp., Strain CCMP1999" /NCGR_SAMPLE_ID=MMETSP1475 /ASSEMBLY_ACC=CAM_ASM_001111 /LENGTH=121 /DNA_ID=CAMNT_0044492257 /DNA_START=422 /DNA_END=787 /DNA_ORIENTATION=-
MLMRRSASPVDNVADAWPVLRRGSSLPRRSELPLSWTAVQAPHSAASYTVIRTARSRSAARVCTWDSCFNVVHPFIPPVRPFRARFGVATLPKLERLACLSSRVMTEAPARRLVRTQKPSA